MNITKRDAQERAHAKATEIKASCDAIASRAQALANGRFVWGNVRRLTQIQTLLKELEGKLQ